MSQQYRYPNSASVTVAAVGTNGSPIPTQSILIAGENPSLNLQPLQTTAGGALIVDISGSGPPAGSATAANQVLEIAQLTAINGKLPAVLGQTTMAGSLSVAIASNQSAIPISAASLPLPTGAATEATLSAMSAKLPAALGAQVIAASLAVNIASNQTVPVSAASLPLPSGAATSANQATELTRLSGSLVPTAYDEIDLTYVPSGAGVGQIATAVYKLATVTVKTLTMSYDGSDRLSSVVAS